MPTLIDNALSLRPIAPKDNPEVANIIRTVMPEFGADGPGFAIHDKEVDAMHQAYTRSRCAYYVVLFENKVAGGGGIAPLDGGETDTCELKKMYFLPPLRGRGAGQIVLEACLKAAKSFGFKQCYLETLEHMHAARHLYEKNGFMAIPKPMGATGHFSCDRFYLKSLT